MITIKRQMEASDLKAKLENISKSIPQKQLIFFHQKSLKNFILYVDSIKGRTEREKTKEIIMNCLEDIEANFEPDVDFSLYIFNNYLKYIVPTFQNRLGFWPVPGRNILFILILIIPIIFILLIKNTIIEIVFICIIGTLAYVLIDRHRKNKVYGFRY